MKRFGWVFASAMGLALVACSAPEDAGAGEAVTPPAPAEAAEPVETVTPAEPAEAVPAAEPAAPVLLAAGEMCGGIAGLQCGEGLYCHMEPGDCVNIADAAGTCREIPMICTREYMPVKGCDGKKYSNKCEANANGTSVAGPWVEAELESEESTGE